MSTAQDSPTTTVGKHVFTVYDLLDQAAQDESIGKDQLRVFRGSFLAKYKESGLSQSYYSRIRTILTDLGSVSELQRGARNLDSVLILHGKPDVEAVEDMVKQILRPKEKADNELEQRVRNLEKRLEGLDVGKAFEELWNAINRKVD